MKNKAGIFIFVLITFASAVQAQKTSGIKDLRWLEGTWKMKVKNGTITENWTYVNDSTMTQTATFVTNDGKIIPQESIELVKRNNEMFYISTVQGQNDGKAISFKLTSLTANGFVSENPQHDFPQKITYTLQSPGKLLASIEGMRNGSLSRKEFPMEKE